METHRSRLGWLAVPLWAPVIASWLYLFWSGFASFALLWVGPTGPGTWEKLGAFGSMQLGLLSALAIEVLLFVTIIPRTGRSGDPTATSERQSSTTALVTFIIFVGSLMVAAGPVSYLWVTGRTGAFDRSELLASVVYVLSSFAILLVRAFEYSSAAPSDS